MDRSAPAITDEREFDFKEIKQRFFAQNKTRLQRAINDMRQRQRDFLELLPLLYHINHPLLPGYVSKNAPAGIADYSPPNSTLHLAMRLAKSFSYKRRAYRRLQIQAIYMMGSTGTIAYSNQSDLDIWVCYDNTLKPEQIAILENKSREIEKWARTLDVEAHIFLVNPDDFRNMRHGELSSESSGSALHHLLLEEFYRTSLLIAGLYPIWWLVPPEYENDYADFVEQIKRKRFVHSSDNLDFGGLNKISAEEFYGATLWSLYKGINSPYKSVLKTLLMESYASEYPDIDILGLRFKMAIYAGENEINKLDPYLMMLHKVEEYLSRNNQQDRLDLIRRSFYFKVNEKLSYNNEGKEENWRRQLLGELTHAWGWGVSQLFILDSKQDWKIQRVLEERSALIKEFNHSYRFLSSFARNHTESNLIHKDDLNLLGRKLYAAFERKAGKVEIIYRGITSNLYESHISIHRLVGDDMRETWVIYNGVVNEAEAAFSSPLKRTYSLIELLAWSYFNKIITPKTTIAIYAYGADLTATELKQLITRMEQNFSQDNLFSDNIYQLQKPAAIANVMTVINAGIDPIVQHTRKGEHLTSNRTDSLSYGARFENLCQSIDQIITTSWNEVLTYRYLGVEGLFKCLQDYSRWSPPSTGSRPPVINAVSYSGFRGNVIAGRVQTVFEEILDCFYSGMAPEGTQYVLGVERDYYLIKMDNNDFVYHKAGNLDALRYLLAKPDKDFKHVGFDSQTLPDDVLPVIYSYNKPGMVQVFFEIKNRQAITYVLDESGSLFMHDTEFYDALSLVNQYRILIESIHNRIRYIRNSAGDIPVQAETVFYYIDKDHNARWKIIRHNTNHSIRPPASIDLQVIADKIDDEIIFRVYCDSLEFSSIEYGEAIYHRVAKYILQKRTRQELYPIYITDIDIAKSLIDTVNIEVRTIHFLNYKKLFELKLRKAMENL